MISAKKKNIYIYITPWNYIKNTPIYQSFIENKWFVYFRKDALNLYVYVLKFILCRFESNEIIRS